MHTNNFSFIMIAAIAFILGAAVTVFCFRIKEWNDRKDKEDDL